MHLLSLRASFFKAITLSTYFKNVNYCVLDSIFKMEHNKYKCKITSTKENIRSHISNKCLVSRIYK